jgi:GT2 family glycosyltransferase
MINPVGFLLGIGNLGVSRYTQSGEQHQGTAGMAISQVASWPGRAIRLWQRGGAGAIVQKLRTKVRRRLLGDRAQLAAWTQYQRGLSPENRRRFQARVAALSNPPRISIVMPVYNTLERWLVEAIESVRSQLYPHWELCIADDRSPDPQVRATLERLAASDSRIKVAYRSQNGGISAASNTALQLATSDFVVLMDHDDRLPEHALLRVAETILSDDPDLFYSDEVLVTPDGEPIEFVFRPAFSLELLRSHPYIVHLVGFRRQLLLDIGGFREFLTVSQDYDLILRASERAQRISHIPEILYLWRQHTTSTGNQWRSDVLEISRMVLSEHLTRSGELGEVQTGFRFNYFRVRYPIQEPIRIAIIIPTKNYGNLVKQCIESIAETVSNVDYEIVVIDHDSNDPESIRYFQSIRDRCTVLNYSGPFNFSAINNWAVKQLPPDRFTHYLFCNNDIEAIEAGWLERMAEFAQKPDIGIVGAKLLYPDHCSIQHAGVCVGMHGMAEHFGKFMHDLLPTGEAEPGYLGALISCREMSSVTAACLLMRRDAFEKIEGYDESLAVGFGDVDLCLRSRAAGYRVIFCADVTLIHHESYTRGKTFSGDPHPEDSAKFLKRWKPIIQAIDPYYNPNLDITRQDWAMNDLEIPTEVRSRCYDRTTHQFLSL